MNKKDLIIGETYAYAHYKYDLGSPHLNKGVLVDRCQGVRGEVSIRPDGTQQTTRVNTRHIPGTWADNETKKKIDEANRQRAEAGRREQWTKYYAAARPMADKLEFLLELVGSDDAYLKNELKQLTWDGQNVPRYGAPIAERLDSMSVDVRLSSMVFFATKYQLLEEELNAVRVELIRLKHGVEDKPTPTKPQKSGIVREI